VPSQNEDKAGRLGRPRSPSADTGLAQGAENYRQRDTRRATADPDVDAFVSWFADWWLRRGRNQAAGDHDKH